MCFRLALDSLYSPGWPQTPEGWDYRDLPPCLASFMFSKAVEQRFGLNLVSVVPAPTTRYKAPGLGSGL